MRSAALQLFLGLHVTLCAVIKRIMMCHIILLKMKNERGTRKVEKCYI